MFKKASVGMWPIVVAIVVIIMMSFLLLFVKQNAEAGDIAARSASCQVSVAAHMKFGTEINCPLEMIKIKTKDQDDALKQVSDSLVRCWDSYGAGKLAIFPDAGTKYCAPCSTITFKNKDMTLPSLPLYLVTHFFRRDGIQINYEEYLMGSKISPNDVEYYKNTAAAQSMDTSKDYIVLFTFEKKRDFWDLMGDSFTESAWFMHLTDFEDWSENGGPMTTVYSEIDFLVASYNDRRLQQTTEDTWLPTVSITYLNSDSLKKLKCDELPVSLTGLEAIPNSDISGAE